jgi:hypothetical protein
MSGTEKKAIIALWKITGEYLGEEPEIWRMWWDENKKMFIKKRK